MTDALAAAPCGCEAAASAARETDPTGRRGDTDAAMRLCAAWRCPRAGHEPDASKLDAPHREALDRVARLTGHRAQTCPLEALYRPEVARAAGWKASRYSPLLEPDPPLALVQAVGAMRAGESEYLEYMRTRPAPAPPAPTGPVSDPRDLPRPKLQRRR